MCVFALLPFSHCLYRHKAVCLHHGLFLGGSQRFAAVTEWGRCKCRPPYSSLFLKFAHDIRSTPATLFNGIRADRTPLFPRTTGVCGASVRAPTCGRDLLRIPARRGQPGPQLRHTGRPHGYPGRTGGESHALCATPAVDARSCSRIDRLLGYCHVICYWMARDTRAQ